MQGTRRNASNVNDNVRSAPPSPRLDDQLFFDKYPPPKAPPGGPEQWELQFCNWWGWSWVPNKNKACCPQEPPPKPEVSTIHPVQKPPPKKKQNGCKSCCVCRCKCNFCPCCCSEDEEELIPRREHNVSVQMIPAKEPSVIVRQPSAVACPIRSENYCCSCNYQQPPPCNYQPPQCTCCACSTQPYYTLTVEEPISCLCNKQTETLKSCKSGECQAVKVQENKSAATEMPVINPCPGHTCRPCPRNLPPPAPPPMRVTCNNPGGCCTCNPRPAPTTCCTCNPRPPPTTCCPCPVHPPVRPCTEASCPKIRKRNINQIVNTCLVQHNPRDNPFSDFLNLRKDNENQKIYKPLSLLVKNNMNLMKLLTDPVIPTKNTGLYSFLHVDDNMKALENIDVCTNADKEHYKLLTSVCDAILTGENTTKTKKQVSEEDEDFLLANNYYYHNTKSKIGSEIGIQVTTNNQRVINKVARPQTHQSFTKTSSPPARRNSVSTSRGVKNRETTLKPPVMTKTGIYCQDLPSNRPQFHRKPERVASFDEASEEFLNSSDLQNEKDFKFLAETSPPFTDLESPTNKEKQ